MRKYLPVFGLVFVLSLVVLSSALAQESTSTATSTDSQSTTTTSTVVTPPATSSIPAAPATKDVRKEDLRQELSIKEIRGRLVSGSGKPSAEITIKAGTISEIGTDVLKVSIFGQAYTAKISADTKLVRQYWGASNVNEFSVGDIVNVYGFLDENSVVQAKTIRNVSIQQAHATFKGTIESINASNNSFVLKTQERGNQTVFVSSSTSIVNATSSASFTDLKTGLVVVVRGVWNKNLSTVQASAVVIGRLDDPRPLFLDKNLKDKMQGKIESKIQKLEDNQLKIGEKIESAVEKLESRATTTKLKIEELQKKLQDLLKKINL